MPSIRFGIADLVGGVSTQPPSLRFPNQVESATNVLMHYYRGMERRPGTQWVGTLSGANSNAELAIHPVEISSTQRYILVFENDAVNPLRAYTVAGGTVTVNYLGSAGVVTALKAYLNVANPKTNLRFASLGVTTVVANRTVVTATSTVGSPYQFGGTNVSAKANAHNEDTWDDFDQPPTVLNEYWYARNSTGGHPAGWWQSISTSGLPWYQRVASEAPNSVVTNTTMPVQVVFNTSTSQFDVSLISYTPRYSGDEDTNPRPAFFGNTISDLTFHRGRLWFSSRDKVCSSQADDLFNFWINDWENIVDSDPINLTTSTTGTIANVSYMAGFRKSLVVFCEDGLVMECSAPETLGPSTVVWLPSFRANRLAGRPDVMGNRLLFVNDWSSGNRLMEFTESDDVVGGRADDVSIHVNGYMPSGNTILQIVTPEIAVMRFGQEPSSIYVYQNLIVGDQRVQSSYHKWTFRHGLIQTLFSFDSTLYVVFRQGGVAVWIETIDMANLRPEYANEVFHIHMDQKTKVTGVYNAGTNRTTFTRPYADSGAITVFLGAEWIPLDKHGVFLTAQNLTTTTMDVAGDYSTYPVVIGSAFTSNVQFSEPKVRDQNGAVVVGSLQLLRATAQFRDTGAVGFDITPINRPTRRYVYTGKFLGTTLLSEYEFDQYAQYHFPVLGSSDSTIIEMNTSSVNPVNLTGLEFTGRFTPGRRSPTTA